MFFLILIVLLIHRSLYRLIRNLKCFLSIYISINLPPIIFSPLWFLLWNFLTQCFQQLIYLFLLPIKCSLRVIINSLRYLLKYMSLFITTELIDFIDDRNIDNSVSDFFKLTIFYFWIEILSSNSEIIAFYFLINSSFSSFFIVKTAF